MVDPSPAVIILTDTVASELEHRRDVDYRFTSMVNNDRRGIDVSSVIRATLLKIAIGCKI